VFAVSKQNPGELFVGRRGLSRRVSSVERKQRNSSSTAAASGPPFLLALNVLFWPEVTRMQHCLDMALFLL
jgi:hypothetical protein